MRAISGQIRADYTQKSRSFSFLAMIALCLFGAFWFVPRAGDGILIMALQPDVFIQGGHPSWIPMTSALGLAFFLPLIGFFYLRDAIQFDEKMGVEQLVSSSAIGNLRYLTGKFLSGALLLYTFAIAVIIGSFFMTIWQYPRQFLSARAFLSPYMFSLISLPLCAAITTFFGSIRFLRGGIGSVVYVMGLLTLMAVGFELENPGVLIRSLDFGAMGNVIEVMSRTAYQQTGYTIDSFMMVGDVGDLLTQPTQHVLFDNLSYTTTDFAVLLIWLLATVVLVMLSAPLYSITKKLPAKSRGASKKLQTAILHEQGLKPVYHSVTPTKNQMWLRGIVAEIKLMLKGQRLTWYLVSVVGVALSLFLEIGIAQTMVLPLLMLWFVNVFSRLGNHERKHNMLQIIATIPGGKIKQITYSWIAGLVITSTLALPVVLRLIISGHLIGAFAVLAGVVFLPSFAMFLGEFSRTNRLYEMLFIVITYFIINGLSFAMYMGNNNTPSFMQAVAYLALGLIFGVVTIYKRKIWA